jgi:hypothetical protein
MISGGDIIAISPAKRISIPRAVHCPEKYEPTPELPTGQCFVRNFFLFSEFQIFTFLF